MKVLRLLAIVSFVAGLALLAAGFIAGNDGTTRAEDPPVEFEATPTPTPTLAPEGTTAPSPTPTPPPFDGAVTRMRIPSLDVDAAIEPIGQLEDGHLDVPHDPHDVGWYEIYDKPGFGGNAVFSAHVDWWPDILGPFHKLAQMQIGDTVEVVMEDGTVYTYQVIFYRRYPVDEIPMGDLIWPEKKPADVEYITLITCGGRFVETNPNGSGDYLDRDVVVAQRVG